MFVIYLFIFFLSFDQTGNKVFLRNASFLGYAIFFLSLLALYTAFLDVPQYIARYRADVLAGKMYFGNLPCFMT